jgi:hypothetical protein
MTGKNMTLWKNNAQRQNFLIKHSSKQKQKILISDTVEAARQNNQATNQT